MSGRKETVVEVIKSLRRELALDADGVVEYVNRFSCAWRRANHRFSVKLAETRSAMNYRNERMARGFRSLDALLDGFDASKFPLLSDCGEGARRIRRGGWRTAACAYPLSGASREAGSTRGARPPYLAARGERLAEARRR